MVLTTLGQRGTVRSGHRNLDGDGSSPLHARTHGDVAANGKVLVAGGGMTLQYWQARNSTTRHTGTWTPTGSLNVARWEQTATRLLRWHLRWRGCWSQVA